jgi:redox-sensitive bicupin YhaK (pirin superfamily)
MVAGRGIVHSERSGAVSRARGARIEGIQSWVALPLEHERTEPRFEHHPVATIPRVTLPGATLDILAGTAFGERSPVGVLSPTLYVHARLEAGASLAIDEDHEERAIYVVDGTLGCEKSKLTAGMMAILRPGASARVTAASQARVMIVGGAKLVGDRHIYWNFVSSSKERIERAKDDWRSGRFPKVPGDEIEFVPLPDQLTPSRTTA